MFAIIGRENVDVNCTINGVSRKITFEDALHTPGLQSNLISISKLSKKGVTMNLDVDKAMVKSKEGIEFLLVT